MFRLLAAEEDGDVHIRLLGQELGIAYGPLVRVHAQDARHDGRIGAMATARFRERAVQRHTGSFDSSVNQTISHLTDAHRTGRVRAGRAYHARPNDIKQTDAHGFPFRNNDYKSVESIPWQAQ